MRWIWIFIQINAVVCFLFIGVVGASDVPNSIKWCSAIILINAAIIEYLGYNYIYKPVLKNS